MATIETTSAQKVKVHKSIKIMQLEKPLVAVACIGQNNNVSDKQAKSADYLLALLKLHRDFRLDAIRQVLDVDTDSAANENDEKKNEDAAPKYRIKHVIDTDKDSTIIDEDEIKNSTYKTEWYFNNDQGNLKDNELTLFCQHVCKELNDEGHGYDGLIFVLTGFAEIDQNFDVDENFEMIADSAGNLMKLEEIFTCFDKNHCHSKDWQQFPIIFMIDRYCQMTDDQMEAQKKKLGNMIKDKHIVRNFNEIFATYGPSYDTPKIHEKIHLTQLVAEKPYAIEKEKKGGVMMRAVHDIFSRKLQFEEDAELQTLFFDCADHMGMIGAGARGIQIHMQKEYVRLPLRCWK